MANSHNIPDWLEKEVRERDKACVYCGAEFTSEMSATWEHIINDASIITRENIALCCNGCNSSKGKKPLLEWLDSDHCKKHKITAETVAPIIKEAIARFREL